MSYPHILIAEDDEPLLTSLSFILEDEQYYISKALDGKTALDIISSFQYSSNPVKLLITDIQMPDLNGLELICKIRKIKKNLPVIVITGYGDKETLKALIKVGCDEFLDKPFKPDDIRKLVKKVFENQADDNKSDSDNLIWELKSYQKSLNELKKELDNAAVTYKDLIHIPETRFNVVTAWRSLPFRKIGGDFFYICNTSSGCDILVADVAGHDMAASYHTILLKSFFDENCRTGKNGAVFFQILNHAVIENSRNIRLISAVFLRINLNTMKAETVSAGHPDLIKIEKNISKTGIIKSDAGIIKSDGCILGLDKNALFEITEFDIKPEDRLFLFTDGIINAKFTDGPSGNQFSLSESGLLKLIENHCSQELEQTIDLIWNDILKFCRYKPNDDMLLLGIEIP
ncbi:Two component system response regulator, PPM-type phosphatase domain-containing protein [Desulfonema limicola]|uniref:Two component system response regulator, PPM-type phosphatase domain-containing protein n=1 Tax=Desulfonema limicola TaxID=45656 RepID=A0A975GH77_9BACT|nr:SpoIIE family protein phosphatase [Desulfonema limicola]QTA81120.1 Two component system response regulator, PPM-type phosphatase domain-containing protein [Desulfonema limicola]